MADPLRGAKNFGRPVKGGGEKFFGLGQYFFKSLRTNFNIFWGVLGTFNFWVQGGGAKKFGRVVRGVNKIRCVIRGSKKIGPLIFLESLGAKWYVV